MSKLQDWCKEISDVVVAAANGEKIQISYDGKAWADKTELEFDSSYKYRIKPLTIKIGDFDVPEPMRNKPVEGQDVYTVTPNIREGVTHDVWIGSGWQHTSFERGLVHEIEKNAEMHAKALIALTSKK